MPPKRAAMAQAVRDAFPEDTSMTQVQQWYESTLSQLEDVQKKAAALQVPVPKAVEEPPKDLLALLDAYQELAKGVYVSVEQIRTVVLVRVPEMKQEDNLGVEVQMEVLKGLSAIQTKLAGSGGDKEGSAALPAGLFYKAEYLKQRAEVEKLAAGGSDGAKDKTPSPPPPSALLHLRQIDSDAVLRLQLGAMQLATLLRAFINTYALNYKKLIMPRESNNKMVS